MFNAFFFCLLFFTESFLLSYPFSLRSLTALIGSEDMHEVCSKHVFILIKL